MLPNQRAGFFPRAWSKGFFRGLGCERLRRSLGGPESPFWMGHEAIIRRDCLTIWAGLAKPRLVPMPGCGEGPRRRTTAGAKNRGAFPALNATVAYSTRGSK